MIPFLLTLIQSDHHLSLSAKKEHSEILLFTSLTSVAKEID